MKARIWIPIIVAAALLVAGGVVAVSHMPVAVTLAPGSCTTKAVGPYGIMGGPLPCKFAAYPFASDDGWVVIGAAGDVAGQCLKIPSGALQRGALKVTWSRHLLFALPPRCQDSYAVYHPRAQPLVDLSRLGGLFGARRADPVVAAPTTQKTPNAL